MATTNKFISFLEAIGKEADTVFKWLASPTGQSTVTAVETAGEITATAFGVGVPVQGVITIINTWMTEAIKAETLATAAGTQDGTGAAKAAAVLNVMTPELTAFLQGQGLTSADITAKANAINNAIVNVLNTFLVPVSIPTQGTVVNPTTSAS